MDRREEEREEKKTFLSGRQGAVLPRDSLFLSQSTSSSVRTVVYPCWYVLYMYGTCFSKKIKFVKLHVSQYYSTIMRCESSAVGKLFLIIVRNPMLDDNDAVTNDFQK